MSYKRKRFATSQPDWSSLDPDLLDLVLKKVKFTDTFRFLEICKPWYSVAKPHISSLIRDSKSQPPLLMISTLANSNSEDSYDQSFFNLEKNQWRKIIDLPTKYDQCQCFGSSNGWLVFLDKEENSHYLLNPVLDAEIKFDNLGKLPWTSKVVLLSDPLSDSMDDSHKCAIVATHGITTPLISYAMCGDESWSNLELNSESSYLDIVCHKDLLYVLGRSYSLEAWDIRSSTSRPSIVLEVSLSFPEESIETRFLDEELYDRRVYLIESKGEFLMVIRYIGYNVRNDGLVVYEADMIEEENRFFSFQYLTKFFYVFKLDSNKKEWKKVESLGDGVIFLGGNQPVLLQAEDCKEYKKNSIYFTDDSWYLIKLNEDSESGGHDAGFYSLEDHSIECLFDSSCIKPPPFWVIPC